MNIDKNEEKMLLEKCNFLDFIYNIQVISDEQYELGLKIKTAFQKTKEQMATMIYEKKYYNNSINTKKDDNIIELVKANRDYYLMERYITKENKQFLEKTICLENKMIFYLKKSKNDKNLLNNLILKVCKILDEIQVVFYGDDYYRRIKKLNKKIKEFGGVYKIAKQLKINHQTVAKILKGNKDFKYVNLEKLENFLNNC